MKTTMLISGLFLATGFFLTTTASAQWFGPWGNENDLATAWGLEPDSLDDPDEGPGETIDYSSTEPPFNMNVGSGSNHRKEAPQRPKPRPRAAPPKPAAAPPVASTYRPRPPRAYTPPPRPNDYYRNRAPQPRHYSGYRSGYRPPLPPMPYYAPPQPMRPMPPINIPKPLPRAPYPYYRR